MGDHFGHSNSSGRAVRQLWHHRCLVLVYSGGGLTAVFSRATGVSTQKKNPTSHQSWYRNARKLLQTVSFVSGSCCISLSIIWESLSSCTSISSKSRFRQTDDRDHTQLSLAQPQAPKIYPKWRKKGGACQLLWCQFWRLPGLWAQTICDSERRKAKPLVIHKWFANELPEPLGFTVKSTPCKPRLVLKS